MVKDPYMIDPEDSKKKEEELKGKQKGLLCPKKHGGGFCGVCDAVQLWFADGGEEARQKALSKMAKVNVYICGVFPSNPEKLYLLQMGKVVGNQLIEGTRKLGWTDITNPKKGVGRCVTFSKGNNGKHNTYHVTISPNKADWDIPKEVMKNLPDLENVTELLDGKTVEIFNISSMKDDSTMDFRICPDPKASERNNKYWAAYVWRHWGVSKDEIEGKATVVVETAEEQAPWSEPPKENPVFEQPAEKSEKPSCFGRKMYFEEDDPDCQSCGFYKACGKTVAKM